MYRLKNEKLSIIYFPKIEFSYVTLKGLIRIRATFHLFTTLKLANEFKTMTSGYLQQL